MSDFINLTAAARCVSELTSRRFAATDTMSILIAGSEGRVPIYWHNAMQKVSALFGLTPEVEERQRAVRWMQVSLHDLARLTVQDSVETSFFEPDEDDLNHLAKAKSDDGYRGIAEKGNATVTREQLFVRERDVRELVSLSQSSSGNATTPPAGTVAVQRFRAQENAILHAIKEEGLEPTAIPHFEYSRPGLKAQVRQQLVGAGGLFVTVGIFDAAWYRLRRRKEIADGH